MADLRAEARRELGGDAVRPSVLVGLVGAGIQASRTPALHEREGGEHALRYIYKLIDLETLGLGASALPDILTAAEWFGFAGLNITQPYKQAVIPFLHELLPDAEALGAVNTVVLRNGRRAGHNTDWWGFAESFRREMPDVQLDRVVQFGAGGAGAAVAHALLTLGARELAIIDTDEQRAQSLADALRQRFQVARVIPNPTLFEVVENADGIVNATPVGMARYPGTAVPSEVLRPDLWVAEIVYFPMETELLRQARARGCRTMSGGGMAVFQAAGAFRLFTGCEPDAERMLRHFQDM